jgi:hypothetical protein
MLEVCTQGRPLTSFQSNWVCAGVTYGAGPPPWRTDQLQQRNAMQTHVTLCSLGGGRGQRRRGRSRADGQVPAPYALVASPETESPGLL